MYTSQSHCSILTCMHKTIAIGLLWLLVSCKPSATKEAQAPVSQTDTSQVITQPLDTNIRKNLSFYEPPDSIPTALTPFIPSGYMVLHLEMGNLNLDSFPDYILVLGTKTEATTSNEAEDKPSPRPLLLLTGQADHSFTLACRNDYAVYCIDCAGGMSDSDPFQGITIKNGYFSIEHGVSSGQHWEKVTTFKYEKTQSDWYLYKDHYLSYSLNPSTDENAEALVKDVDILETVKDFGRISFKEFNTDTNKKK